jgi:hypothetical protein
MPPVSPIDPEWIPLSLRPSQELHARALELRHMAATARTSETRISLEALAARFTVMAVKREHAEAQDRQCGDVIPD